MIWWIDQPARALLEQSELDALAERCDWLEILSWRPDDALRIEANLEIKVGERKIALRLVYPEMFPRLPAMIFPATPERLSGHQYGSSGELCLEWRPDNWRSDITGKMLVESAFRLLSIESAEVSEDAPSEHSSTLGQKLRGSSLRFLASSEAIGLLRNLAPNATGEVSICESKFASTWVASLEEVRRDNEVNWKRPTPLRYGASCEQGLVFRLTDQDLDPQPSTLNQLSKILNLETDDCEELCDAGSHKFILLVSDNECKLVEIIHTSEKRSLCGYETILLSERQRRLPHDVEPLSQIKVAIIGCGSLGSKVAVSLARIGIRRFFLVDCDIFLPGNVQRNELDTRAIGTDKNKATEIAIMEVCPDAEIELRSILLGRQESARFHASTVSIISECDVIVEATADERSFALTAAIAESYKIPMFWGVVFEGGIGALLARARPDIDPRPSVATSQIQNAMNAFETPWEGAVTTAYETELDGAPLIASDTDVSALASNLTRLVSDALTNDPSDFPYSAYLLGFKSRWEFRTPFDTIPIELVPTGGWGGDIEEDRGSNLEQLVARLIPDEKNES